MSNAITRTFNYLGEKVTIEVALPTNKEQNAYTAARINIEDDAELLAWRAAEFDKRVTVKSGPAKEQIFDAAKSQVMFHLFENFSIDAKN